jgi:hypothetical protein
VHTLRYRVSVRFESRGERVIDEKLITLSVERSLRVFAEELPNNRWTRLQDELRVWQINKFGCQSFERVVLGIGEELGELAEAAPDSPEEQDAVGDISVYSIQLCTAMRLDAGTLIETFPTELLPDETEKIFGRMCHVSLKHLQGIRGFGGAEGTKLARSKLGCLLASLFYSVRLTGPYSTDAYYRLVDEVAGRVVKRDPKLLPPTIGATEP